MPDLSHVAWRKSSRSGNGGQCVEVARSNEWAAIRDSKSPSGAALVVTPQAFTSFTEAIKADHLVS